MPALVSVAIGEIVADAREGLLAMAIGTGLRGHCCIKAKGVLATPRSVNQRPLGTLETVTNQTPKGPAARI